MIIFTDAELQYIENNFKELFNPDNKDMRFLEHVRYTGQETIDTAKELLTMWDMANKDQDMNEKILDTAYYVLGMYAWREEDMNADEVAEYIEDPEYLSIYQKVYITRS